MIPDSVMRFARALNARQIPDAVAAVLLITVATVCALLLITQARNVEPVALPSLRLPAGEVAAVIEKDRADARALAASDAVSKLEELFLRRGAEQRSASASAIRSGTTLEALRQRLEQFRIEHGEKAVRGLRARAVERLEAALDLALPDEEAKDVLGAFPVLLDKYDAARDGLLVAPHFVIRTMYKSRWNLMHGLDSTRGLARVEEAALFGWLALHGEGSPLELRRRALEEYLEAGGPDAEEARGVMYFKLGLDSEAVHEFEAAYQRNPSIRIRNHLIAARNAAGM
jgi:hypothetical protein